MALETAGVEREILRQNKPDGFSLYVSIPFCPSRCLYCSFVSHDIKGMRKLLPEYLRLLQGEIRQIADTAGDLGLKLQTIYIGGGTPTTLEPGQMEKILTVIRDGFSFDNLLEYTVEAGRPDTMTLEKLSLLRRYGVNRLSVNPQTMDDAVLRQIGRGHTALEIEQAYEIAREAGFSSINMDLIAGLPGDSPAGFWNSLRRLVALRPENITVHTLARKRAATDQAAGNREAGTMQMLRAAEELLPAAGYAPYYMYRQSRSMGNLENIGWSLPGLFCRYNIDMMEESHTVLACGAGGVTKLKQWGTDYLERVFSFKYPYEYVARFAELLARKERIKTFDQTYNK
jgi:oxygen-independent coproporphyrinogen-3 oxidase